MRKSPVGAKERCAAGWGAMLIPKGEHVWQFVRDSYPARLPAIPVSHRRPTRDVHSQDFRVMLLGAMRRGFVTVSYPFQHTGATNDA